MSAISGPRSPSSPWPSESPNLQRAGPSNPAALFPLYDPHPSPRSPNIKSPKTAPSGSGSSYFSISVDSCVNSRKKRDTSFYSQYSITNPESQCLPKKTVSDKAGVLKATLRPDERKESSNYALTLNRDPNKQKLTSDCSNSSLELNLGNYYAVSAEHCAELLESYQHDVMLLDVRPFAHFAKGNIKGSLNLCIPTTLLKRPSFDTKKLENTFTDESDKRSFARWRKCRYIAVYDAATSDVKDAVQLTNVLKKFTVEGWNGEGLILLGGFNAFSNRFPTFVQQKSLIPGVSSKPSPMQIDLPAGAPISGGCALPDVSHPIVPFFGNIRQHMDLLGGVGQIPLQLPKGFTEIKRKLLPTWLCEVADPADKGRNVSEKFLDIEKRELERMKQALSYNKSVDSTSVDAPRGKYRVAGIEKGAKNRYNDVYPFDHSRVRLQDVPRGDCDYVNANYMKAEYSNKRYIATQAPVPDTFNDFWRVVWEQDVQVVVSLTAEIEKGQVKCHPYWQSGNYGPLQVNNFSQRYIYMDSPGLHQSGSWPDKSCSDSIGDSGSPCIIMRHFSLSHSAFPFQPLREVTQLQYPYWPDFGTTSQPSHLLKLIAQCDKVRSATANTTTYSSNSPNLQQQRPVLVHCSAGCGRTGSFCTVDSVLDMLKQQGLERIAHQHDNSTKCSCDNWLQNEDLIAKTVADFRTQRPGMVQNLSQFVLCYESVLEWTVSQMEDDDSS